MEATKSKLKITTGEWINKGIHVHAICDGKRINIGQSFRVVIRVSTGGQYLPDHEAIANTELFADAGTTANKCGLLPSELLTQRDELLHNCKELIALLSFHGYNNATEISNAQSAIEKSESLNQGK
jgi:hypothetical protein